MLWGSTNMYSLRGGRMALCLRPSTTTPHSTQRTTGFVRHARSTQVSSHVGSQLSTPNVDPTTTNGKEEKVVTAGFCFWGWD